MLMLYFVSKVFVFWESTPLLIMDLMGMCLSHTKSKMQYIRFVINISMWSINFLSFTVLVYYVSYVILFHICRFRSSKWKVSKLNHLNFYASGYSLGCWLLVLICSSFLIAPSLFPDTSSSCPVSPVESIKQSGQKKSVSCNILCSVSKAGQHKTRGCCMEHGEAKQCTKIQILFSALHL